MANLRKQRRICTSAAVPASMASPGTDSGMYRVPRRSALEQLSSGDQSMMHVWRMCLGSEFAVLRRVSWTLYRSSLRPGNGATLKCKEVTFRCWNATAFPLHALTLQVDFHSLLRRLSGRLFSVVSLAQRLRGSTSLRSLHIQCHIQAGTLNLAPLAQLSGLRELAVVGGAATKLLGVSVLGKLKYLERLGLRASPLKELVVPPSVRELHVACDHPESLVVALPRLAVLSLQTSAFPASLWSEIVDRGTRLHTLWLDVQGSVPARWGDARPKNIGTAALTHLDLRYFDWAGWPGMLLPTLRQLDIRCSMVYQARKGSDNPFTRACPAALETCTIHNDRNEDEATLRRTLDCLIAGPSVHSLRGLELSGLTDMDVDLSSLQLCSALRRLRVDRIKDLPRMPWLTDLSIGGAYTTKSLHKQVEQLACNMPGLLVLRIIRLTPEYCMHVLSQLPRLRHLVLIADSRTDISDCLNLGFCEHGACPSGASLHFPSLRLVQVNRTFDAEAQWAKQCRARGIVLSNYIPPWSVHGTHDTG